jgi:peptidoglycan/xylan/chitin deacetylase (PgdA/CDA1 family)
MSNPVIVTTSWDDGHILDKKLASLLYKYGIKGTFYVAPKNREFAASNILNDQEIQALSHDFEIGAHTLSHVVLNQIDNYQARYEIKSSKQYLENLIQKQVSCFCYPKGVFRPLHAYMVRDSGYLLARTTETFSLQLGHTPYLTPTSIHAYDHWSDLAKVAQFTHFSPGKVYRYYHQWDALALAMFDRVLQSGGVFHLWGHSWEIEKFHHWHRLEKLLRYLSFRQRVSYLTNGELI